MKKETVAKDFFASFVVFLVAFPISLGVAVAAGVEPHLGLTSAIIGGLVASTLTGAPLQITGPSTGLAVMVLHVVQNYGIKALIPLGLITGLFQIAIALAKIGHLFQATPPALVKGMLSGIGFLIMISQFYILMEAPLSSESYLNILNFPSTVTENLQNPSESFIYGTIIGVLVLAIMTFWSRQKKIIFHLIPGSLVAVVLTAGLAFAFSWDVQKLHLSQNISEAFGSFSFMESFAVVDFQFVLYSLGFAFVASVETMLCVSALDKMTRGHSKYNKTILAQGIGNLAAGAIGTIPVVGVISRSAPNVEAGGKTKLSGILYGFWVLAALFFPFVMELIPVSALVGLLLFVGYKLLDLSHIIDYAKNFNRTSWIFATTFILTITVDLLIGVIAGFIVAIAELLYEVLKYDLVVEEEYGNKVLKFTGKLSFLDLPVLNEKLTEQGEEIPSNLEVCLREVQYLDPAVKEQLDQWVEKMEEKGVNVKVKN